MEQAWSSETLVSCYNIHCFTTQKTSTWNLQFYWRINSISISLLAKRLTLASRPNIP